MAERGFNQAAEIANRWRKRSSVTPGITKAPYRAPADSASALWHGCERVRQTTPQEGLTTLRERRRNLRGAFACTADIASRHVLLIDDVVTTGASADECARTLKLRGSAGNGCGFGADFAGAELRLTSERANGAFDRQAPSGQG